MIGDSQYLFAMTLFFPLPHAHGREESVPVHGAAGRNPLFPCHMSVYVLCHLANVADSLSRLADIC